MNNQKRIFTHSAVLVLPGEACLSEFVSALFPYVLDQRVTGVHTKMNTITAVVLFTDLSQ